MTASLRRAITRGTVVGSGDARGVVTRVEHVGSVGNNVVEQIFVRWQIPGLLPTAAPGLAGTCTR